MLRILKRRCPKKVCPEGAASKGGIQGHSDNEATLYVQYDCAHPSNRSKCPREEYLDAACHVLLYPIRSTVFVPSTLLA